jgi:selenoprotein W-related protein
MPGVARLQPTNCIMSTTTLKCKLESSVTDDRHTIEIEYCVPCDFRPEAIELTRQIVVGWSDRLSEIRLVPSSGGRFEVSLDGDLIFSKAGLERHAEPNEIASILSERIGAAWQIGAAS